LRRSVPKSRYFKHNRLHSLEGFDATRVPTPNYAATGVAQPLDHTDLTPSPLDAPTKRLVEEAEAVSGTPGAASGRTDVALRWGAGSATVIRAYSVIRPHTVQDLESKECKTQMQSTTKDASAVPVRLVGWRGRKRASGHAARLGVHTKCHQWGRKHVVKITNQQLSFFARSCVS
jgi:hypothetical protein